jgi:hypothetical protein
MDPVDILIWLAIGAVAGWLAGQLISGGGFGLIGDIVVGIVGSVIAGYLLPSSRRIAFIIMPPGLESGTRAERRVAPHFADPSQRRRASARFTRLTRGAARRNKCGTTPRPTETGAHRPLPDPSALFQRLTNRTIASSTHAPMKALITARMKPAPIWNPRNVVGLVDRQGIHIRAQSDRGAIAGSANVAMDLAAKFSELRATNSEVRCSSKPSSGCACRSCRQAVISP